jgi:hypothetical protein
VEENNPNGRRISPSVDRVAESEVDKSSIKRRIFSGCFTALITPLRGGKIDEKVFQALVDWQVREGINVSLPKTPKAPKSLEF